MTAREKAKHKKRKKIFDDKDLNIMQGMQEAQRELNDLIMNHKLKQTEKYQSEQDALREKLEAAESNEINQHWKRHFKKIDDVHAKRNQKLEGFVKA